MLDAVSSAPSAAQTAEPLKQVFGEFVGEVFYGQMLAAMRASQGEPAYLHGGRAEEVFQGQLDQLLSQNLAAANGGSFAEELYQQQFVHVRQ